MNKNQIFEQLKREAFYAQRSFSTELLYQTYGVLLYFQASDTGPAVALRPLRSDPKNLNGGKDDGNYH